MLRLTDTHCHLNLNSFEEDLPAVVERALSAGIDRILVPGIDLETSLRAIAISDQYPEVYAAIGVHPSSAASWTDQTLTALRNLTHHAKVVAVGEIGLDYYRDRSPRELQKKVFLEQLDLALEVALPVVVHNREAFHDLWPMLEIWQARLKHAGTRQSNYPGVLHSFEGNLAEGVLATDHGFFLGFGGPVTYKNAHARQALVSDIDPLHILLETDAPFLTPHPHRGKRNEPAFIKMIGEKIAELHQLTLAELAEITTQNASRLFAWEP